MKPRTDALLLHLLTFTSTSTDTDYWYSDTEWYPRTFLFIGTATVLVKFFSQLFTMVDNLSNRHVTRRIFIYIYIYIYIYFKEYCHLSKHGAVKACRKDCVLRLCLPALRWSPVYQYRHQYIFYMNMASVRGKFTRESINHFFSFFFLFFSFCDRGAEKLTCAVFIFKDIIYPILTVINYMHTRPDLYIHTQSIHTHTKYSLCQTRSTHSLQYHGTGTNRNWKLICRLKSTKICQCRKPSPSD